MTTTTTDTVASFDQTGDERAARQVLDGVYAAWANNDAEAMAAFYTEDAIVVLPGEYREGKDSLRDAMAAGFEGPLKGSRVTSEVESVRVLGNEAAIVISKDGILMAGETDLPADRYVRSTWVLANQDGRWLAAAYQNCPAVSA